MSERNVVSENMILNLGRGVRYRYDKQREAWTLMAPERVIVLDEIAQEVMHELLVPARTLAEVIDSLVDRYNAPREEIAADVRELVQTFVDKKFLIEP